MYSQRMVQEFEMNEGSHVYLGNDIDSKIKIKSKIDDLNQMLSECVTKKYLCQNAEWKGIKFH